MKYAKIKNPILCCLIFVFFIIFRIILYFKGFYPINSDNAITGIMALDIFNLKNFPVFYYGQYYFLALESYLLALVGLFYKINFLSLTLLNIFLSSAGMVFFYFSFVRFFKKHSFFLFFCFLFSNFAFINIQFKSDYSLCFFLSGLCVFLFFKNFKNNSLKLFIISLICSINFLVNPQSLCIILTIIIYLLISKNFKDVKKIIFFLLILLVIPFLLLNLYYSFKPLIFLLHKSTAIPLSTKLKNFIFKTVPILINAKSIYKLYDNPLKILIYLINLFSIFIFLINIKNIFSNKFIKFIIILFIIQILLFLFSSFSALYFHIRYLMFTPVCLFFLYFFIFRNIKLKNILYSAIILIYILSYFVFPFHLNHIGNYYDEYFNLNDAVELLKQNNIKASSSNYWLAYRLSFFCKQKIISTSIIPVDTDRIKSYTEKFLKQNNFSFLFTNKGAIYNLFKQYKKKPYKQVINKNYILLIFDKKTDYFDFIRYLEENL